MPLALDTQQTADYWLASDAAKPAEARPTLLLRFLSKRDLRKLQDLRRKASAETDNAKCDVVILDALMMFVADWRNMPEPFSRDAMDLLTLSEQWEVLNDGPGHVIATEADRKKSYSQGRSDGDASAKDAPAPASASAPQPSPNPSFSATPAPAAAPTP